MQYKYPQVENNLLLGWLLYQQGRLCPRQLDKPYQHIMPLVHALIPSIFLVRHLSALRIHRNIPISVGQYL